MARKPQNESDKPIDFEQALAELTTLVERLERGDLALGEALTSFERGVALTRQCQSALASAQQRVELLLKDAAGATSTRAFDPEADDGDSAGG
jgi:exodeoxyribonuclease VII small subunit